MRCAVCGEQESVEWFEFQGDDLSEPRTWVVCASCAQAVRQEIERAHLRTPTRVRIAIAMVASERKHGVEQIEAIEALERSSNRVERLLIGTVLAAFLVHALAFVVVIAFIAANH